jgi:hypothetical protein
MPARKLPSHLQFHPAPAYANWGAPHKYPTFAAMRADIAWLLGVDEDDIREIDNSDRGDGDHDDELALNGEVVGSFWLCPGEAPAMRQAAE